MTGGPVGDRRNWVIALAIIVLGTIITPAVVAESANDWQQWAIVLAIFVVGLLLGAVTRSLWSLLVPLALALLWILYVWLKPVLGPEELPRSIVSIFVAAFVLGPGLLGAGLGIALGRVLRQPG